MSDSLALRLRDHGIAGRLEVRGGLAIVIPDPLDAGLPLDREARLSVLQLLRAEGFTHVALELDPDGASLPGA